MSKPITTIFVTAKCSDMCSIRFYDEDGVETRDEHDGYVPDYFPEEHYGDYLELEIDIKTGQILNWEAPTQKQLNVVEN